MNKKAILGNIIGAFVVIMVGVTMLPTIAQQLSLATSCPEEYEKYEIEQYEIEQADTGNTDSFGGGGSEHFGGYTGQVEHKDFLGKVGEYSVIKTDSAIFGRKDCSATASNSTSSSDTLLNLVPIFFILAIVLMVITIVLSGLRSSGLISGKGGLI